MRSWKIFPKKFNEKGGIKIQNWDKFIDTFNSDTSFWDFSKQRALNEQTTQIIKSSIDILSKELIRSRWSKDNQLSFSMLLFSRGDIYFQKMKTDLRNKLTVLAKKNNLAEMIEGLKKLSEKTIDSVQANARILKSFSKFLGFIYENERGELVVSNIGRKFLEAENEKSIILTQLLKYQSKNPTSTYLNKISPIRFTLKVLSHLKSRELSNYELVLFVMRAIDHSQLSDTVKMIEEFRSLETEEREAILKKLDSSIFEKIERYVPYVITAFEFLELCKRSENGMTLIESNKTRKIIKEELPYFDFNDNINLWIRYYCNSGYTKPPKPVTIKVLSKTGFPVRDVIIVINDIETGNRFYVGMTGDNGEASLIVPRATALVRIEIKGKPVWENNVNFDTPKKEKEIEIDIEELIERAIDFQFIKEQIMELLSQRIDKELSERISLVQEITGERITSRKLKSFRGGRLEQLFYRLFKTMEKEGRINSTLWYGEENRFGLPTPAPPGPDIQIIKDDHLFVIETTTLPGNRQQWSAEGSSVPGHIREVMKKNSDKKVVGIFIAPSLHEELKANFRVRTDVQILPVTINRILEILENEDWFTKLLAEFLEFIRGKEMGGLHT